MYMYFLPGFFVETYSSLFLLTFASLIFGSFVLSTFIDLIIILLLLYIHAYNGLQKKNNNTIYCEFLCTSCLFDTYYNSQEIIDHDDWHYFRLIWPFSLKWSTMLARFPPIISKSFGRGNIYDYNTLVCCCENSS